MIEVYITTGGKKENSTKRLSFEGATPYQCALKTPTSIERPVITLTEFIPGARYAYIPSFKRYYFIEDIVCAHNQTFNYYLSIDVLGTYRDELFLYTLYSVRSSAGSRLLPDPMYTHKNNVQLTNAIGQFTGDGPGFSVTAGTFALETVGGGSSNGSGGTTLYLVTPAVMSQLMAEMFNPSSSIYGSEFDDDVVKTYFNPFQYVVSCKWFPFGFGSGTDRIKFGFWESSYTGIKYTSNMGFGFTKQFEITVPKPNGEDYTSFSPSWVNHLMYVPMFGYFPIDPKYSGKTIIGHIAADLYTGNGNLEISVDGLAVQSLTGQCGVSVNLSQLSVDTSNIGTTLFGTLEHVSPGLVSEAFSGKSIDSFFANAIGIASSFISKIPGLDGSSIKETMSPTLTMCGTQGNRMVLQDNYGIYIHTAYFAPDNANDVHGMFNYPDDRERRLDTLTGYAIFKTDAVGIGNAAESAAILAHLNGGVFLE